MSVVVDSLRLAASAAGAAADGPTIVAWGEVVEKWHDFYLMTGTAAVTLAGLLFIALSLHMEILVQEQFSAMLLVARSALTSFVFVLVVSIVMLVPFVRPRMTGVLLIAFMVIFTIQTLRDYAKSSHHHHDDFPARTVRRRVLMPLLGYLFVALSGYGLLARDYSLFFDVIGGMILLLVNAAYASWDLLIRASRARQRLRLP